jgi:hypothetical protein
MIRHALSRRAAPAGLAACLLLAACATPQQRCINDATRNLRVVGDLIAQAETNLARGYGIRQDTIWVPVWEQCTAPVVVQNADGSRTFYPGQMCLDDEPRTVNRPVAIDLEAERRKLSQLQAQRKKLEREAGPAVAACRAAYPE